jgi:hypothetical protein
VALEAVAVRALQEPMVVVELEVIDLQFLANHQAEALQLKAQ